jgi:hypothetical protein
LESVLTEYLSSSDFWDFQLFCVSSLRHVLRKINSAHANLLRGLQTCRRHAKRIAKSAKTRRCLKEAERRRQLSRCPVAQRCQGDVTAALRGARVVKENSKEWKDPTMQGRRQSGGAAPPLETVGEIVVWPPTFPCRKIGKV